MINRDLILDKGFYKINSEDQKSLESHPIFNIFLIFSPINKWIFELVAPSLIDILELTNRLNKKVEKTLKEYSTKIEYFQISVLEEIYHIWNSGDNLICFNLNDGYKIPWINSVLTKMNTQIKSAEDLCVKSSRILLISEFFDHSNIDKTHEALIDRLIFDDFLYSKLEIRFKDLIPQMIDRTCKMFSIDKDYLTSYFNTNLNTIEFLRTTECTDSFEKLLNVIDFINRRNLCKEA